MSFAEIDLFGVCVAPVSVMVAGAWLALLPLRSLTRNLAFLPRVWHPPLFWSAAYVLLLSALVLLIAS
jgi:hypothetical protein